MSSAQSLTLSGNIDARANDVCFHCGLPNPQHLSFTQSIHGKQRKFCCPGCQMVCSAIYDAGLDGFYDRMPGNSTLAPPPDPPKDLALYDLDDVQQEFVGDLGRKRAIHLLVEGIHCAACVWLIERALHQLPGVLEARVNLAGKRLIVSWDNEKTELSAIIHHLTQIGYAAVPYDPEVAESKLNRQNRTLLFRMAFAGFTMMNLLWISIALYSGADRGEFRTLFHWVGFALATPTLLYSGYPFFRNASTGLKQFHLTMDLPIAIGAAVTYLYSVYITVVQPQVGEVYYDTVVNFLFVILVGRYLEAISKRQAISSTQRLLELQPRGATVIRDSEETLLPVRAIKTGETVLVKPGDRIPVDGTVMEGRSIVDESMLSGEASPVAKSVGEHVAAGTLNVGSALTINVEGTLRNTSLGRIIHLVEEAQASKAPIQCTADRIVPWFVATTLALASITFSYWLNTGVEVALMAATAVLIITCPCAFGLATPMAIASASGLGARRGILVKNGAVLETLSHIDHVVFDKTGTLTEGRMQVEYIIPGKSTTEQDLLALAAAVETFSEHSIAKAIHGAAKERHLAIPVAKNVESHSGYGIKGTVGNRTIVIGNYSWLRRNHIHPTDPLQLLASHYETAGKTCVHIAVNGTEAGLIAIADRLRPDARALIKALHAANIDTTLLSGDRRRAVDAIAQQLGGMHTIAEVLPQDKDRIIRELQQRGARVAMIGDGINDAPALMRADVGIALGSGTEVSADSADIVLMSNELSKVRLAIQLSQRTLRTIRQNISLSVIYNIIMVPLAMAAMITPLVAAIAMPISSLLVIGNAARIRTLFKQEDKSG
ncbi:MAG: heavy metal translocating P-type ATPase [Gammaproteobacteria bacterium]